MDISQKTKKYRIPKIEFTELKKFNKLKCPNEDASVPLRREKKAIISGEGGRERPRRESGQGGGVRARGEPDLVLGEKKD